MQWQESFHDFLWPYLPLQQYYYSGRTDFHNVYAQSFMRLLKEKEFYFLLTLTRRKQSLRIRTYSYRQVISGLVRKLKAEYRVRDNLSLDCNLRHLHSVRTLKFYLFKIFFYTWPLKFVFSFQVFRLKISRLLHAPSFNNSFYHTSNNF